MLTVSPSACVPYSAQQMFALVNDVQHYPEFLTGCLAAEVLERRDDRLTARLTLGYKMVRMTFVTENTLEPPRSMRMHLVSGPFRQFEGEWCFEERVPIECRVTLNVRFELSNIWLNATLGKQLCKLVRHQVDAMCQRAHQLYG